LRLTRFLLYVIGIAFIMSAVFLGVPTQVTHAATLKELQDQLKSAESNLAKYQDMKNKEHQKAETYSDSIQKTQQQIQSVKSTIQSLEGDIAAKESDLAATSKSIEQKTVLLNKSNQEKNNALATYYELTNLSQSSIMMADSRDLSHYDDRTEYVQAIQDNILKNIEEISRIKAELEGTKAKLEQKKNELAALKGEQLNKSIQLASVKQQQVSVFNKAKANEAQYQEALKKLEADKHKLSNEIYTLRQRMSQQSNEKYVGGTSGYPYSAIHAVDPWRFLTRECTSYAAWKWNVVYGRPFENTRPGQGSAWNWPALAQDQGYRVSSTPSVTAIVSWSAGPVTSQWGHVAIVEKVNSDGTIDISEYNYVKYSYSYRQNVRYQDYGKASFIMP
jgi:peptidoglycan DL-endopeptidase CwlO